MGEHDDTEETVRVELSAQTLCRLLDVNALCATEFHCLDCESKDCLWSLLLRASAVRCARER